MGDTANLKLGPAQIEFNSVDLGFTEGGITVTIEDVTQDVKADQVGDIPAKQILTGRSARVTAPIAELTPENLERAIPGATLTGTTNKQVNIPTSVGLDLLTEAQELVLKPLEGGVVAAESEWVTFHKAAIVGTREISYSRDTQRVLEVEFVCYPDSSNNLDLGFFGYATPA